METRKVGILAAKLMEEIAQKYEDGPCVIGEVMLVVEIKADPEKSIEDWEGSEFEDFAATVETRCTDDRVWVQMGLLNFASEGQKLYFQLDAEDD